LKEIDFIRENKKLIQQQQQKKAETYEANFVVESQLPLIARNS